MKIGILVDSASTSTPKVFEGTNIRWIPLHITFPDNSDILDITEAVEKNNVYKRLENGEDLKTSQASPGELENKYIELLKEFDHLIHIPITGNLSSMLQTAFMVANDEQFEGKVTVYPNYELAAQAIKEAALYLNKLIANNDVKTPKEAIAAIDEFVESVYIGMIPGDLRKLASSGRLRFMASVLNFLKTKTLIRWGSKPEKEGMSRTYGALVEKIIDNMKNYPATSKLIFLRTPFTSSKTYNTIVEALKEAKINFAEEFVPSIYTVHAGVETVGFIIVKIY
ncbi:DegV family protein [Mesoplasma photuris]|uniref:DegV family protein n=1 Tax=Mesoplasma photuris TaxID=217731 RepID=UPI0004E20189|nr:DegV family protein [Mesoplasma photuris]